jgi:hypothetical protein
MMLNHDHPDTIQDYHRLKAIEKGSKQAIETSAMNAMWDAIERGESKEEASKIFFSFFNKGYGVDKLSRSITR